MRRLKISEWNLKTFRTRQGVSAMNWADALNMVVGYSILVAPVAVFVWAVRHFYPPDWPYLPVAISVFPVLGLFIWMSRAYMNRYAASLSGYFWYWIVLAVCIWFLHGGITKIVAAYHHSGGGYVGVYERDSSGETEWVGEEWADESQYKRDQYVNGTLITLVGAIGLYSTIVVYIHDRRKAGLRRRPWSSGTPAELQQAIDRRLLHEQFRSHMYAAHPRTPGQGCAGD